MAIDTEQKRRAAAGVPLLPVAVLPDGTIGDIDRWAAGWSYFEQLVVVPSNLESLDWSFTAVAFDWTPSADACEWGMTAVAIDWEMSADNADWDLIDIPMDWSMTT